MGLLLGWGEPIYVKLKEVEILAVRLVKKIATWLGDSDLFKCGVGVYIYSHYQIS